jgi:2-dehydro-3-deoxyphosphogluconate aldolase / (4S)-4-hydroxy-2-oxoglutarate aldolase
VSESLLDISPVIPVVVIEDAAHAVPLARALVAGGVPIVELTLRTAAALESVRRIAAEVPDIFVGAGTVIRPEQATAATAAGAQFLVSPGSTSILLDSMTDTGLPHLPGCSTVSEALALLERGYQDVKFFPAEACGGVAFLKAVHSPVPAVRFCPTGGITSASAGNYLSLPNVGCVGASWLTPPAVIAAGEWDRVSAMASETLQLRTSD